MLKHYVPIMWTCAGTYICAKGYWAPIGIVAGAFMIVLSLIEIFGA